VRSSAGKRAAVSAVQVQAVFLVGFMGAGKSSVGRALGLKLGWVFEDLDDRIERREGRTVAEIFRDSGEAAFRQAESAALNEILRELRSAPRVVALGGGAFVQKLNANRLKASGVPTVFLDAPVEELWRRCNAQATESGAERPLLKSAERFRELYASRSKKYAKAQLRVETGSRSLEEIAEEIAAVLKLKASSKR